MRKILNYSQEVFMIKNCKNTVPWTSVISGLNSEEIVGTSYGKELQKTNQEVFWFEKVIKRKGDKLNIIWKDYNKYLNS